MPGTWIFFIMHLNNLMSAGFMFEHEETKYELLASSNVLICVRRGVFPWFGISERKLIKTVRQDFIADFM